MSEHIKQMQKCICYYFNFMDIQEFSMRYLPSSSDHYSRHLINTLIRFVLFNLPRNFDCLDREYDTQCELRQDENINLIFYVFNLVWDRATDLEKRSIITIRTNYYYINFPAISKIIREHSWQVCQLQAPNMPPFSISTGLDANDCIERWDFFRGPKYSISVNDQLHDPTCQYVLFLSNFEEIQVIDQIIGIRELVHIIKKYIYLKTLIINT
jgi:hypothetical protein